MTDLPPTPPRSPAASPPRRWGRLVLIISLALNLIVAGIVAGAALGGFGRERSAMAVRDVGFGSLAGALSSEDRKQIRRAFAEAAPGFRDDRRDMRRDMQQMLVLLRTDPLDQAALRALMAEGATRVAERHAVGQAVIVDHLAGMTAAQRADFADRLEKSLKERGHRDRGRDGGRDRDRTPPPQN